MSHESLYRPAAFSRDFFFLLQEPDMRSNYLPVRHQMSYRNAGKWYKWVYACLKKSPRKSDPVRMWLWSKIMFYPTNRLLFQPNWIGETTVRARKYSWPWNFTEKINSHMASEKSKSLFFNRLVFLIKWFTYQIGIPKEFCKHLLIIKQDVIGIL